MAAMTTRSSLADSRGRTRAAYTFTQEAVREFQVNAANYAAQYGGAAGVW